MRNTLIALSMVSVLAGAAPAFAQNAAAVDASVGQADGGVTKLDMPAYKSRRKMLFSFGLFGTGIHIGWKKPMDKADANGQFRGVGSPIFYTSVGSHGFGLGTPKREKVMLKDNNG